MPVNRYFIPPHAPATGLKPTALLPANTNFNSELQATDLFLLASELLNRPSGNFYCCSTDWGCMDLLVEHLDERHGREGQGEREREEGGRGVLEEVVRQSKPQVEGGYAKLPPLPSSSYYSSPIASTSHLPLPPLPIPIESIATLPPSPLTQTPPKPFRCPNPLCPKSYKQINGLSYHLSFGGCSSSPLSSPPVAVRGEKGDKPYACWMRKECGKRYLNKNGLKYHYEHSGGEHREKGLEGLRRKRKGLLS